MSERNDRPVTRELIEQVRREGADWRLRLMLDARLRHAERAEAEVEPIRAGRKRGGGAEKYLSGVQDEVARLDAANPRAKFADLWEMIPEGEPEGDPQGPFIVYRDGDRVVQVEDKTGRERSIAKQTLRSYLTRARRPPRGGE